MLEALRKVLSTNGVVLPQHPGLAQSTKEGRGAVLAQVDSRISELPYGARTVFVSRQDSDHFWDTATMP